MSSRSEFEAGKRFALTIADLGANTFSAVSLTGVERISQTWWFELDLVSEKKDIQFKDAIHKGATLEILGESGRKTTFHGVVTRFQQREQIDQVALYRVRMEPWLSNAQRQVQSEVYLDKTVPAIIGGVFKDSGLSINDYQLRLSGDVNTRSYEYLCQYEESDLNFLQWLLEQDGVYYFFEDDGSTEKAVFANNQATHGGASRKLTYKPVSGTELDINLEDSVQRISRKSSRLPKTVLVRNYDYRKASLDIRYEEIVSNSGVGQITLYGEPVGTQSEAQKVAKLRAEEIACRGVIYEADATAVGIRPGMAVELTDHYRSDFNAKYWVTEVRHEGSQSGAFLAGLKGYQDPGRSESALFYRCTFKAIPSGVQYRPPRTTKRPTIDGTLSGFVDAEGSGKYAELDDQGRYKVQVPFDLTDKRAQRASAWLRFATPYAGPDEGMHFPLRKGSEVLLSFEGGDPNRPIIIGAVANSEHTNLVTNRNATHNMLQTGGGNLLQMEDQEGSQHILLKTPTANTFIAMGATAGAAPATSVLATTNGDSDNGNSSASMVQYTQADQLIQVQGSAKLEVGPNASITNTLSAGDSYTAADGNMVQTVGNYSGAYTQLNAGSVTPAIPAQGDVQINAANNLGLWANGKLTTTCNNFNITCNTMTETKHGMGEYNFGEMWRQVNNQKQIFTGMSTSINLGGLSQIYLGDYNRVYPARITIFAGWKLDTCPLTKFEWNWGKLDMITGLKVNLESAKWGTSLLRFGTIVTKSKLAAAKQNANIARIKSAVTRAKSQGVRVKTAAFLAVL